MWSGTRGHLAAPSRYIRAMPTWKEEPGLRVQLGGLMRCLACFVRRMPAEIFAELEAWLAGPPPARLDPRPPFAPDTVCADREQDLKLHRHQVKAIAYNLQ